ncbi:hypothetical protein [Ideonella sp. YS5]|uniref:hypothetical protein n=1 Tax=Ideonella sp. YS5 TaxID=3453714 RepID=UPI003EEB82B8
MRYAAPHEIVCAASIEQVGVREVQPRTPFGLTPDAVYVHLRAAKQAQREDDVGSEASCPSDVEHRYRDVTQAVIESVRRYLDRKPRRYGAARMNAA